MGQKLPVGGSKHHESRVIKMSRYGEDEYRIIDGRVYQVHYDSFGNPYLKYRGVLVEDELE